jgi:hypothetical protein
MPVRRCPAEQARQLFQLGGIDDGRRQIVLDRTVCAPLRRDGVYCERQRGGRRTGSQAQPVGIVAGGGVVERLGIGDLSK